MDPHTAEAEFGNMVNGLPGCTINYESSLEGKNG